MALSYLNGHFHPNNTLFFQLFQPDFTIFFNFSNLLHANQIKCFKRNYNLIIPVDIRILDLDRF